MAEQDEHALISDLLAEAGRATAAVHDGHRAQRGCGDVFAVHLGDARLALDSRTSSLSHPTLHIGLALAPYDKGEAPSLHSTLIGLIMTCRLSLAATSSLVAIENRISCHTRPRPRMGAVGAVLTTAHTHAHTRTLPK